MKDVSLILNIPLYYTIKYKTKKDKTILVNNNFYRNAYYRLLNDIKHFYTDYVISQLINKKVDENQFNKQIEICCVLYYKNQRSDLDNYSILLKFVLDALVKYGYIEDDNISIVKKIEWIVGSKDKEEPRLEIKIKEI